MIAIDGILPLLLELRERYPDIPMHLVFSSYAESYKLVLNNVHIRGLLERMNPRVTVLGEGGKIRRGLTYLALLFRLAIRPAVVLKTRDPFPLYAKIIPWLRMFNRIVEIRDFIYSRTPEGFANSLKESSVFTRGKADTLAHEAVCFDYLFCNLSRRDYQAITGDSIQVERYIPAGYLRALPGWRRFWEHEVKTYPVIHGPEYFFYILNWLDQRREHLDEPTGAEMLRETLLLLKPYCKKVRTIFRYHPNFGVSERERINNILSEVGYDNYIFDDGHPTVLASRAKFVIGNLFSNAFYDIYPCGTPIIEYSQVDPEIERTLNGSLGGSCCDFYIRRDAQELRRVVQGLLSGELQAVRPPDFLARHFSAPGKEFWEFWGHVLSRPGKTFCRTGSR